MKATILIGDVLTRLREMPDASVQCAITSPPYWGLRDYGTGQWTGGDAACDHSPRAQVAGTSTARNGGSLRDKPSDVCKCGAIRIDAQLGLEKTPDEYIAKMVDVFAEVRRVLRNDAVLWLNIGDSYASSPAGNFAPGMSKPGDGGAYRENKPKMDYAAAGIKPKDLVGIPWMLAFALRADGWYLRQDIIWAKPNPMPESMTDRCTKSHEYLFLLTKSARYYYDAEAIKEPAATDDMRRPYTSQGAWELDGRPIEQRHGGEMRRGFERLGREGANIRMHQNRDPSHPTVRKDRKELRSDIESRHRSLIEGGQSMQAEPNGTRNKRSVWTIATQPYSEAHFATFPEALVEPCILAGSKEGDTVLDPFCGSGTTGVVALRYHRDFVGIELNPAYAELAENRIHQAAPMFNDVSVLSPPQAART